eukprot:767671-Rhodomonas_salina.2
MLLVLYGVRGDRTKKRARNTRECKRERAKAGRRGPVHVLLVALGALLPEARVHVHEQLLDVEREPVDRAIPVLQPRTHARCISSGRPAA